MPRAPHHALLILLIRNGTYTGSFSYDRKGALSYFESRLILLLCLAAFSLAAYADEWNKTYQVGTNPALHVETNDASIEVSHGVSNTINIHIVTEGYSIGNSGVRITERQDGDKVDLSACPESVGHSFQHAQPGVHVQVQVPSQVNLDLHSADGHIGVNGVTGMARLDTGMDTSLYRTSPATFAGTPATDT